MIGHGLVLLPDGSLSDMVNLTRAKDACAAMAATTERQGRQSHREAPHRKTTPLAQAPARAGLSNKQRAGKRKVSQSMGAHMGVPL